MRSLCYVCLIVFALLVKIPTSSGGGRCAPQSKADHMPFWKTPHVGQGGLESEFLLDFLFCLLEALCAMCSFTLATAVVVTQ